MRANNSHLMKQLAIYDRFGVNFAVFVATIRYVSFLELFWSAHFYASYCYQLIMIVTIYICIAIEITV